MALIIDNYNAENKTDQAWFNSSNVYYAKFVENEKDNNGQLYVTFNNGATYHYKDVDMPHDYLLFKHGGIDGSQGKTLNKLIKGHYEFEKVDNADMHQLNETLNILLKEREEKKLAEAGKTEDSETTNEKPQE